MNTYANHIRPEKENKFPLKFELRPGWNFEAAGSRSGLSTFRQEELLFKYLLLFFSILFLSILDGFLTHYLIFEHGVSEWNPVMAYFLEIGPVWFFGAKYLLTACSLIILFFPRSVSLLGSRRCSDVPLWTSAAAFFLAVVLELHMICFICR